MSFIDFFFLVLIHWLGLSLWCSIKVVNADIFFQTLGAKISIFHYYDVSWRFFKITFIRFLNPFLLLVCWFFLIMVLNFIAFPLPIKMCIFILFSFILITENYIDLLQMFNQTYSPRINFTWSWCTILLIYCWICFLPLGTFTLKFIKDISLDFFFLIIHF